MRVDIQVILTTLYYTMKELRENINTATFENVYEKHESIGDIDANIRMLEMAMDDRGIKYV